MSNVIIDGKEFGESWVSRNLPAVLQVMAIDKFVREWESDYAREMIKQTADKFYTMEQNAQSVTPPA